MSKQIHRIFLSFGPVLLALLPACTTSSLVPSALQAQMDRSLTFSQLRESPTSYSGRVMILGGEVLGAKRLKIGTRIEVLQLPLDRSEAPVTDRTASEGRFLAIQKEFLDPATIPPGTRITIVGEVTGATTLPLDETDYTYPTLDVKTLKVWPKDQTSIYWYGPYRGPYWYPSWRYRFRHGYWW